MDSPFTILTPNAMLGYGFNETDFWNGIFQYKPAAIIVDSGSTDGGPYKLGMNMMTCGRESYIRDLRPLLKACFHNRVKVLIGSAGGDGSNSHVEEMLSLVEEITNEEGFQFRVATIANSVSRDTIRQRLVDGAVHPCGPVPGLDVKDVDEAVDIVAQMGAEPYLKALQDDPDIVIGSRSYDPAPFAAFCLARGVDNGVAWHMGKIMECGGICAVPKGRSMIACVSKSHFELVPLSPLERCTPLSVAAHTLYEKTRPDRLPGPGGVLHLDGATYEQLPDNRTVRVSGAQFAPTPVYQIKLEGVKRLGHRTIFIGGIRDPILISQIDDFLDRARRYTQNLFPALDKSDECRLLFQVYGRNAVMGPLEPQPTPSHEIGILGEVVAPTKAQSHAIANNVRASILHMPYAGQLATTGNFASPLSPHEQDAGDVFKFSVYHLLDLKPGEQSDMFPVTVRSLQSDKPSASAPPQPMPIQVNGHAEKANPVPPPFSVRTGRTGADGPTVMMDIAKVIRSKNSGPFELTLDIMFDDAETYRSVKKANLLTNEVVQGLFHVQEEDILVNMYFDPALAWKCTLKRPWAQGSIGERDTLGTQQHAPLLSIVVPDFIR